MVVLWEERTDRSYCMVVIMVGNRGADLKLEEHTARGMGRLLRGIRET